ncbi:hypothetical protein ES708_18958 [subsurface metagenome]
MVSALAMVFDVGRLSVVYSNKGERGEDKMALSTQDQGKLLAAGYVLYRLELREKRIKVTRSPGCWRTYGKYETQRECQKTWDFLMMNDLYISG